jgi:hypothetical protein
MGYGNKTEPDDLEDRVGYTHGIANLVKLVNTLMDGLDVDKETSQLPGDVQKTLTFLHDADERGQAFRYGTYRVSRKPPVWEPVRPNEVGIYLDSAVARLKGAAQMLVNGLGGYLDATKASSTTCGRSGGTRCATEATEPFQPDLVVAACSAWRGGCGEAPGR